jgi:hypothetical protein
MTSDNGTSTDRNHRCRDTRSLRSAAGLTRLLVCAMTLSTVLEVGLTAHSASAATTPLKSKLLSGSDLPPGWSVRKGEVAGGSVSDLEGCLRGLSTTSRVPKGEKRAEVEFVDGTFPATAETLDEGKSTNSLYSSLVRALSSCGMISFAANGIKISGTVGALSLPPVAHTSVAYSIRFTASGETFGIDLFLFKTRSTFGAVSYEALGTPNAATAESFATAAADKLEGKPVTSFPGSGRTG